MAKIIRTNLTAGRTVEQMVQDDVAEGLQCAVLVAGVPAAEDLIPRVAAGFSRDPQVATPTSPPLPKGPPPMKALVATLVLVCSAAVTLAQPARRLLLQRPPEPVAHRLRARRDLWTVPVKAGRRPLDDDPAGEHPAFSPTAPGGIHGGVRRQRRCLRRTARGVPKRLTWHPRGRGPR